MAYGLGDLLADAADSFDVSLPEGIINQFNDKIGFNDNDQLAFDFPEFSGFLGAEEGELNWVEGNGNATYKYSVILNDDDGLEGSFNHNFNGKVGQFWKDVLELPNWDSATEDFSAYWSIDPVDMKATYGFGANQVVTAINPNSLLGVEHNFHYSGGFELEIEASDSSFDLTVKPHSTVDGWDSAPDAFGSYWFGDGDYDYKSTIVLSVPEFDACDDYFNDFNQNSECIVTFESSDLGDEPVLLKLRHKFGFIKFENNMAYVKSENIDGNMVSFEDVPYLSFYYTENAASQPFKNIQQKYYNVQDDLYLTVPVMALEEVIEAVIDFSDKFTPAAEYAFENPVECAYWVDFLFDSVKPTTFDVSDIVALSRFAIIDYSNAEFTEDAKDLAEVIYEEISSEDFEWLDDFREYVISVQQAKDAVKKNFVLPQ